MDAIISQNASFPLHKQVQGADIRRLWLLEILPVSFFSTQPSARLLFINARMHFSKWDLICFDQQAVM